jgi:hypothetical protein
MLIFAADLSQTTADLKTPNFKWAYAYGEPFETSGKELKVPQVN